MRIISFILLLTLATSYSDKVNGLTLVAPAREFPEDPIPAVKEMNASWIAVVPYAFTRQGAAQVHFDHERQWWGERSDGAKETIRLAHNSEVKVLLKPQVWIPGSWVGNLDFPTDEKWESWEEEYRAYILNFAKIAAEMKVEALCIGTELKISVQKREIFWRSLIKDIREIYDGKLTYAANWDEYPLVPFWDALDCIGVDAYFPLVEEKTPSVESLVRAWQPTYEKLKAFSKKTGKPIAFTEYGYLSLDGCAYQTWALEKKRKTTPVNQQAQANALQALYQVFWKEDWWVGGFLWKWYPNYELGNGHSETFKKGDYSPQGKISEGIIQKWFSK